MTIRRRCDDELIVASASFALKLKMTTSSDACRDRRLFDGGAIDCVLRVGERMSCVLMWRVRVANLVKKRSHRGHLYIAGLEIGSPYGNRLGQQFSNRPNL